MRFDDFNYDAYNKHILVDQNIEPYNAQTVIDLDGFVPQKSNAVTSAAAGEQQQLTSLRLSNKVMANFQFDQVDVRTENEVEESQKELLQAEEEARQMEEQQQEKRRLQELEEQQQEAKSSEQSEAELEDEGEAEYEYEVFFKTDEIVETRLDQKKNLFAELQDVQREAAKELEEFGVRPQNKFIIEEWAPEDPEELMNLKPST